MEKIELRKVRDIGALFNDTIAFLRNNGRSFFGTITFLAGPFILITGFFLGYFQSLQSKIAQSNMMPGTFGSQGTMAGNFMGTTLIFMLILLLTTLVANASVFQYFKVYDKTPEAELPLERSIVSPGLAASCWRLFYNMLLLILILFIFALVFGLAASVLLLIPGLNIVVGIAFFLAYFIFLPMVAYILSVSNYLVIRDEILITEALGKVFRYMKGNFWWTWLYMVCAGLCCLILLMVLYIPYFIYAIFGGLTRGGSSSENSIFFVIAGTFLYAGSMLVINPIFLSFGIFNLYSQEEKKEGRGLLDRIDEIK